MNRLYSNRIILALLLVLCLAGAAKAQGWTAHRLGEVAFEVPADWSLVARTRNREMSFQSPDGGYQFRLSWWLPDEPLLGYDDIVAHRTIQVAGRAALLIHSRFPQRQSLQLAFEQPRADGRQLLLLLESDREDFSRGSYLFDDLVNRLRFDTQPAVPPVPKRPLPGMDPAPPPAPDQSQAPAGVLREEGGAFSIRQPAGWQRNQAERDGLRILSLVEPQRQALVLVVMAAAADNSAKEAAIQAYRDLYYGDMAIPNSIEGDQERVIGGLAGRQLEISAEVYPVEGVRLPFTQGRSYEFQAVAEGRAYLLIGLHGEQAPDQVRQGVADVMASFRAGSPPASGGDPLASTPEQMPSLQQAPADLAGLQAVFGTDCQWLPATPSHPFKGLLEQRPGLSLHWLALCRQGQLPVAGVHLDYDPQGQTRDYFLPLYLDLLAANGNRPLALVETRDRLVIEVAASGPDGLSLDYRELAAPQQGGGKVIGVAAIPPAEAASALPVQQLQRLEQDVAAAKPGAMTRLAMVLMREGGELMAPQRGIDLLERAAAAGDADAMAQLADEYASGILLPRDRHKAQALREQAAKAGSQLARWALGME